MGIQLKIKYMIYKSLSLFILVTTLLAYIMGLIVMAVFIIDFPHYDTWISFLGLSILIIMGVSFFTNFLLPVSINRKMAILVALPTVMVFIYFFAIRPFFTNISPGNRLEDLGFQFWWSCVLGPVIEGILLVGLAYFGWLGTRLKIVFTSKTH